MQFIPIPDVVEPSLSLPASNLLLYYDTLFFFCSDSRTPNEKPTLRWRRDASKAKNKMKNLAGKNDDGHREPSTLREQEDDQNLIIHTVPPHRSREVRSNSNNISEVKQTAS